MKEKNNRVVLLSCFTIENVHAIDADALSCGVNGHDNG